jgi:glucose/arabinose dehydrogenase
MQTEVSQERETAYPPLCDGLWGRPIDVEVMRDGSLLVSGDHAGVIYRSRKPMSPDVL